MGSVLIRVITAPSRKTSTPQDSHSQVKASSCQALKHLNHLTKLNLQDSKDEDKDSLKTPSATLLRQVFNVSSFLRFFVSSRVLRKSYEDTRLPFSWCGAVTCESGKAFLPFWALQKSIISQQSTHFSVELLLCPDWPSWLMVPRISFINFWTSSLKRLTSGF